MNIFSPNIKKLKEKHDVTGLIKAMSYQKDFDVSSAAAKALGDIKADEAVLALIKRLNRGYPDKLRAGAAYALGKIKNPIAFEPLAAIAKQADRGTEDYDVIRAAISALYEVDKLRSVNVILDIIPDEGWMKESYDFRSQAANILESFLKSADYNPLNFQEKKRILLKIGIYNIYQHDPYQIEEGYKNFEEAIALDPKDIRTWELAIDNLVSIGKEGQEYTSNLWKKMCQRNLDSFAPNLRKYFKTLSAPIKEGPEYVGRADGVQWSGGAPKYGNPQCPKCHGYVTREVNVDWKTTWSERNNHNYYTKYCDFQCECGKTFCVNMLEVKDYCESVELDREMWENIRKEIAREENGSFEEH